MPEGACVFVVTSRDLEHTSLRAQRNLSHRSGMEWAASRSIAQLSLAPLCLVGGTGAIDGYVMGPGGDGFGSPSWVARRPVARAFGLLCFCTTCPSNQSLPLNHSWQWLYIFKLGLYIKGNYCIVLISPYPQKQSVGHSLGTCTLVFMCQCIGI